MSVEVGFVGKTTIEGKRLVWAPNHPGTERLYPLVGAVDALAEALDSMLGPDPYRQVVLARGWHQLPDSHEHLDPIRRFAKLTAEERAELVERTRIERATPRRYTDDELFHHSQPAAVLNAIADDLVSGLYSQRQIANRHDVNPALVSRVSRDKIARRKTTRHERLLELTANPGDACIDWPTTPNGSLQTVAVRGVNTGARVALGRAPTDHRPMTCGGKTCVNPLHFPPPLLDLADLRALTATPGDECIDWPMSPNGQQTVRVGDRYVSPRVALGRRSSDRRRLTCSNAACVNPRHFPHPA